MVGDEHDDLAAFVAECREAVAAKPNNAPNRVKLGQALEETGDLKSALSEYRAAVAIAPKYGKGVKNVERLVLELGAEADAVETASIAKEASPPEPQKEKATAAETTAANPKGNAADMDFLPPDFKPAPTGANCAGARELPPDVLAFKTEGNAHVAAKKYTDAVASYTQAIKALDAQGEAPDAKLHTNRAAAYLSCEPPKYVGAAMDGQLAMETDPEWWKVRAASVSITVI
jgi:tetratricopeptide (TPR) repeat protein